MSEAKPNKQEHLWFRREDFNGYFPNTYIEQQIKMDEKIVKQGGITRKIALDSFAETIKQDLILWGVDEEQMQLSALRKN